MTILQMELLTLLNEVEKSTFIHLVTETKVKMKKIGNPYYEQVIKRSSCNYLMGNDYGVRVLGNGDKEGIPVEENTFEVEEMKGKRHVSKVVVENTNKDNGDIFYLMVERFNEIKPKVEYIFEGNPIDKVLFENFMNKVYESTKQPQERKVMVITFKVSNIKECSFGGTHYIVE